MNRGGFFLGLVLLLPLFVLAVHLNGAQAHYLDVLQSAVLLEVIWLVLSHFVWLATRWQRGHWDASALGGSVNRRWFLLIGVLVAGLVSIWGGYLGILDRVMW